MYWQLSPFSFISLCYINIKMKKKNKKRNDWTSERKEENILLTENADETNGNNVQHFMFYALWWNFLEMKCIFYTWLASSVQFLRRISFNPPWKLFILWKSHLSYANIIRYSIKRFKLCRNFFFFFFFPFLKCS